MAQHSLMENVRRNTEDWFAVKAAVRGKGVDCPDDTPTAQVAGKIGDIQTGLDYTFYYEGENNKIESVDISLNGGEMISEIPEGTETIGSYAYTSTIVPFNVVVPEGVVTLENYAFANCRGINGISLPSTLINIGEGAFEGLVLLDHLYINGRPTVIPVEAFLGCYKLQFIDLPSTIARIETRAFFACDSLVDIYFEGTQAQWESIHGLENVPESVTVHFQN